MDDQGRPTVFVSYSYDSEAHESWVLRICDDLIRNGVDVIVDKKELRGGADIGQFMERAIRDSDRVLVICTEAYVEKADGRRGGAGYEIGLVTAAIHRQQDTTKFVPIVRQVPGSTLVPACMQNRMFYDMSDDEKYAYVFLDLLQDLYDRPRYVPPERGPNPFVEKT